MLWKILAHNHESYWMVIIITVSDWSVITIKTDQSNKHLSFSSLIILISKYNIPIFPGTFTR